MGVLSWLRKELFEVAPAPTVVEVRVAIFEDKDSTRLGKTINRWLEEHPGIKIERILQTSGTGRGTPWERIVISIWYEGR